MSIHVLADTFYYWNKSNAPGSVIDDLKKDWAESVLARLKVQTEVTGQVARNSSVIFVGNHISYLDIPLLMAQTPQVAFVAKHELSLWPVFGVAAKRINTVFVKRANGSSRRSARENICRALINGQQIAIFPSGTTCLTESKPWRRGAFEIAHELGVKIQPFRINYQPLREVAYIGRDFFPWHIYKLAKLGGVQARIEFHSPMDVVSPAADCDYWREWSRLKI